MGKGGGSTRVVQTPSRTDQTRTAEPWGPTQQPLQDLMNEALSQYYSEPSVVGYRAPTSRRVPIYETTLVTRSGSPIQERDLYQAWNGSQNRFARLPATTRRAISDTLEEMIAESPGLRQGHTIGLQYLDPSTRDRNASYYSGIPQSGPSAGRMIRIGMGDILGNPIRAIQQAGLDWQDVVQRAGISGGGRTGGGRRITGYRTETTPGSPGVYIAPETRMLADFLSGEALNRRHYARPVEMYGDFLRGASQGALNIDPSQFMVEGDFDVDWQGGINPYARAVYNQMAEDVRSNVQGAMNLSGRIGSGANTRILSEELGQLGERFYQPIYEAEQQRRFAAQQGNVTRRLQVERDNKARRQQIVEDNRQFMAQAASRLPQVAQARREVTEWIADLLGRAGDLRKQIRDRPRLERTQALQRALGQLTALGGLGGVTNVQGTSTSSQPVFSSPFGQTVGGLAALAGGIGSLAGGFGWSGREFKDDISEFDPGEIMEGIRKVPVKSWRYKPGMGLGGNIHVGPIAQEYNDQFPSSRGGPDNMVDLVDAFGVALAGIKDIDSRLQRAGI